MNYTYEEGKTPRTGNSANHLNKTTNRLWMHDQCGERFTLSNFWARIIAHEPNGVYAIMGRDANDHPFQTRISEDDWKEAGAIEGHFQTVRGPLTAIMPGAGHDFALAIDQLTDAGVRMVSPLYQPKAN